MNILITGASRGLGMALVSEFINRDAYVWGVARTNVDLLDISPDIKDKFTYLQCDVTKRHRVKEIIENMVKGNFIPDIIVFNAGSAIDDVNDSLDYERFVENYNVNLFGAIPWIEEFLPIFLKRKSGVFAAISSLSIYRENHKNRIAYSSSKLALSRTFENLRLQYYSSGVRFIVFCPGRMSLNKRSFVGTTYKKAARFIVDKVLSYTSSFQMNFPMFQYILTRLSRFIPDRIYFKYILK